MTSSFDLLRIAGDLHAAALEPDRWPAAWQSVCDYFNCAEVLGRPLPAAAGQTAILAQIAARTAQAGTCVRTRAGACGKTDDDPRLLACRALVPHLEMALAKTTTAVPDPQLLLLDALPFPVFICSQARRLHHANLAGQQELERKNWLCRKDYRLQGVNGSSEKHLADLLARVRLRQDQTPAASAGNSETPAVELLTQLRAGNGALADLRCRPITQGQTTANYLLRLLPHTADVADRRASFAELAALLGLTPRQTELAQHLLAGATLVSAAKDMGIVRGTANELLKRLFIATDTTRQTELLTYLAHRLAHR